MKLEEVPAEAVLIATDEECKHCGGSINWWATIGEDGRTVNPVCCHRCRAAHPEYKPEADEPPKSRWVPVEERLPESGTEVKVLRDWDPAGKDCLITPMAGVHYWRNEPHHVHPVTHWLEEVVPPLPERPKEDVPEPPWKWVRWGIGECRNRARTGERYVGVSAADGVVKDIVWMAGIRGEEHFADIHQGGRAALPSPGWIIREEDFLALCPGPWSEGKGEA